MEEYWTMQRNHDISKCKIVLAFRGNLTFNNTRKRPKTPPHPLHPHPTPTFSYRLQTTTQNERDEQNKLSENSQDKNKDSNKTLHGTVVIRTHGIPKEIPKTRVFKCHLCGDKLEFRENFKSTLQVKTSKLSVL